MVIVKKNREHFDKIIIKYWLLDSDFLTAQQKSKTYKEWLIYLLSFPGIHTIGI